MMTDSTNSDFKPRKGLPPFCWKEYLAHIDAGEWCPSDLFSFDHMSPDEIRHLADQIENLANMFLEEGNKVLGNDYECLSEQFQPAERAHYVIEEALLLFEEASEELSKYAEMMFDDAAFIRLEIVKRRWDSLVHRISDRKDAILRESI